MITTGYLSYDFFVQKYLVKDFSPLGKQILMHHIMGPVGFMIGLNAGYGTAGVAMCSLLVEVSTIFLNYKAILRKRENDAPLGVVNQLCFFTTYTIFRMILYPYMIYNMFLSAYWAWPYLEPWRKVC